MTQFWRNFEKSRKKPVFDPFWPIFPKLRFFLQNRFPSLFTIYGPLTSCKKSETSYDPVPVTLGYWLTDTRTDWQGVNYRTSEVGPTIIEVEKWTYFEVLYRWYFIGWGGMQKFIYIPKPTNHNFDLAYFRLFEIIWNIFLCDGQTPHTKRTNKPVP